MPKAPNSNAKPNKSGTNDNSSPPNEASRWKEVVPQSDCGAPPNREFPKRGACDPLREWENEERPNEELPNREFSKFDRPRLRSKEDVGLLEFCPEDWPWPDQFLDDEAAFGGRFVLKADVDLGALANEGWSRADQPLEAEAAVGGRFELKGDDDLGALVQED
jgi:hypothetical protein